jgi:hypothetical protein
VAENCGNLKASWALNVHEKGIGRLHKSLQLVSVGFKISGRVQKIDRHFVNFFAIKTERVQITRKIK